ncbi:MAG: hypothetical protein HOO86_09005 [Bacteroidales bacterium]|nr:hypothetical protein [Bacteroidales bacterium]
MIQCCLVNGLTINKSIICYPSTPLRMTVSLSGVACLGGMTMEDSFS